VDPGLRQRHPQLAAWYKEVEQLRSMQPARLAG
jgi:hypothetical protein